MLLSRLQLMHREEASLASYATLNLHTRGRIHPEPESEHRLPFQKDRDRILHTTAFRRLEYKTQVFVNYEGDYYRTRLTHTLEVAQVARSMAVALGVNETLTETIALSHDLGHPPFGHAGEHQLDHWMKSRNAGGFNHNEQAFRIVTELEKRYQDFSGLNLSWETLEGIVKHDADAQIFPALANGFEPHCRPSLEAQIAAIADGVAYNTHDLDDGIKAGILTPHLLSGLKIWDELVLRLNLKVEPFSELSRRKLVRELLGWIINDILQETERRLQQHQIETAAQIRQLNTVVVAFSAEMQQMMAELKRFLYQHLYYHPSKMQQTFRAEHFIDGLFSAYLKQPRLLPLHVQACIPMLGLERTICDYIAGMTDRFAMDEYSRLYAPREH
ncbi:deoxyguanosinetriphosphate triphosphohydrolase [Deinococcus cellulosilyticus]|uniref:Deoxyguanosinetriphosphate triphosphohydrolase-like protein n=1 Tax=Deinococcus cellulosilyticus (strain DSM 18568 / NBRC 106333 / KACC 11606 / 5516J-15) TaxID=1223518 RepID=A0A511NAC2_DEIC1|nr:deoxyguanosinetriphosphate triphosphohydrolase [Deinococcus cellulosilyticus]GEM49486.1 deoxyguanosinetriphosphate triphosphohydrolase-like protein [Deinococcus cellulosilyticus NBRC 106333 = KACC 11606]